MQLHACLWCLQKSAVTVNYSTTPACASDREDVNIYHERSCVMNQFWHLAVWCSKISLLSARNLKYSAAGMRSINAKRQRLRLNLLTARMPEVLAYLSAMTKTYLSYDSFKITIAYLWHTPWDAHSKMTGKYYYFKIFIESSEMTSSYRHNRPSAMTLTYSVALVCARLRCDAKLFHWLSSKTTINYHYVCTSRDCLREAYPRYPR